MRLLQLIDQERATAWDLHPRFAVIEAGADSRAEIIRGIRAVLAGQSGATIGQLEVHGIILDFDTPTSRLLALDGAVDPVVGAEDLPRRTSPEKARNDRQRQRTRTKLNKARAERAAALEAADRLCQAVQDRLQAAQAAAPELAADRSSADRRAELIARAAQADAEALAAETALGDCGAAVTEAARALEEGEAHAVSVRDQLADCEARYEQASGGDLNGDVGAPVSPSSAELRTRLEEAEAALDAAQAQWQQAAERHDLLVETHERLRTRRAEVLAAIDKLDTADPAPVREALEQYHEERATGGVDDPRAQQLADLIEGLERKRRTLAADTIEASLDDRRQAAVERLDAARAELNAAQKLAHRAMLDGDVRHQIEAAHEAVLAAEDRADRRIGGGAWRKKLVELRATEEALLVSHGLSSFSDYLLTSSTNGRPDPAGELRFSVAKAAVAEAERALAHVEAGDGPDPVLAEIEDQQAARHREALTLLGGDPDGDIVEALRARKVPRPGLESQLAEALRTVGIAPARGTVADAATAWLNDREEADRQRSVLAQQLADIEAERGDLAEPDTDGVDGLVVALRAATARRDAIIEELHGAERLEAERAARLGEKNSVRHELAAALSEIEALRVASADAAAAVTRGRDRLAKLQAQREDLAATRTATVLARNAVHTELDSLGPEPVRGSAATPGDTPLPPPDPATAGLDALQAELAAASGVVDELRGRIEQTDSELSALADPAAAAVEPIDTDAAEFYLLSRLASQRSVGFLGSVPVVVDDALHGLDPGEVLTLLARLDRMTDTIQVVYLTEDATVVEWAGQLRPSQGAVAGALQLA
jgi:DNA repair exonuclease SbcCD ATPase subunit